MRKYIYSLLIMILLHACNNTITIEKKVRIENKKYFNSALAAKILFDVSFKYFQYGTMLYPRQKSKILRYVLIGGEPPYKMKIVKTKKPLYIKNKKGEDVFYSQAYIHNKIVDSIYNSNGELMQFYNEKNEKSHFEVTKTGLDINATRSYYTSCSFYRDKVCMIREFDEQNMIYEAPPSSYSPKIVNKIFNDYVKYYQHKEIIYDNQNRITKKIDYQEKKVIYYFYKIDKKHEVICDYARKKCTILFSFKRDF